MIFRQNIICMNKPSMKQLLSCRIAIMNRKILAISSVLIILGFASIPMDASKAVTAVLIALSVAGFAYSLRGTWYLGKASRIIRSGMRNDYGKASECCLKALKAGLSEEYAAAAVSTLVQYGDAEQAKPILAKMISSGSGKAKLSAKAVLSQCFFIENDPEKAIELAKEAMDEGYQGRALRINMLDYLLRAGRIDEFRSYLEKCRNEIADSPAIEDFSAVLCIADGDIEGAGKILCSLLGNRHPSFSDPYVHYALVHMHYGERKKAIELLKEAENLQYTNMSVYPAPMIASMVSILEGSYAGSFMKAVSSDMAALLNGRLPDYSMIPDDAEDITFPKEPDFTPPDNPESNDGSMESGLCTDLTEDDEDWLRRHQPE